MDTKGLLHNHCMRIEAMEMFLNRQFPKWWRENRTPEPEPAPDFRVGDPVPDGVRWTDVEFSWRSGEWHPCKDKDGDCDVAYWIEQATSEERGRQLRLTAQYDHQPITYAQFREILGREDKAASEVECKPSPAPDFRVGDLVEVVKDWREWGQGERFIIEWVGIESAGKTSDIMVPFDHLRKLVRP